MVALIAEFPATELDQPVRLSIFDSHLEITIESEDTYVTIKVDAEELGSIRVEPVLGVPVLAIEDTSGTPVASLAMEEADARAAERVLIDIREGD